MLIQDTPIMYLHADPGHTHQVFVQLFTWDQYKRRTHKRRTQQTSDSTNVRRTNVGPVQT